MDLPGWHNTDFPDQLRNSRTPAGIQNQGKRMAIVISDTERQHFLRNVGNHLPDLMLS